MSTFKAALHGTSWAVAAQLFIGAGQIAYSALTARVFSPHAFGEFTAALSLQALIVLSTATGLSSFVLKEARVYRSQLRAINLVLVFLALLGAAAFWLVSPFWLAWLNSPGGTQFVPLLTCATFAAPIGVVHSALLRREGDGRADAVVYVSAFIVGTGAAAICAILLRQAWTLALGTVVNPVILIALSQIMRRSDYPDDHRRLSFDWFVFALRVTGQTLVFFGLGQVPTWSLGASTAPATLGQFSRGNTLASLPAYALIAGMNRGTQPHWRKVETNASRIRGVSEALLLASSLSFVGFGVLAALSHPLTTLWLGPGWDLAAEFTAWLAIGLAMLVPTSLLANYLEMTGALSRVRWIQLAIAIGLAPGVGLLVWFHDFRSLLAGFVLSHLLGLITAAHQVSAALDTRPGLLLKQLIAPLVSATGAGGMAFGVVQIVAVRTNGGTPWGTAAQLCSGAFAAILLVFLTRKWQPAVAILVARGVLRRV